MFLHSDANAFYVSCQTAMEPSLIGKPVIVTTNNDGAIAALNTEAKSLGLKRGQPLFEIQQVIRDNHVRVFSSNFVLYGDFSARFHTTIGESVPAMKFTVVMKFLHPCMAWISLSASKILVGSYVKKFTGIPR
ncbi:DNA-directed DNA polymerase [Enterobacter cloacae]|uniref:DNA-directed DNA polymerase n=1 Tax=Enterobacter cloacae TaxID=550 RepID=A0A377LMY9_ENTCL|nr:DNA-directed DNA polymerase [Enterobacter cloacae]